MSEYYFKNIEIQIVRRFYYFKNCFDEGKIWTVLTSKPYLCKLLKIKI